VTGIDSTLRTLTIVAAVLVYVQIVLGALITHAGFVVVHLAGALAVFAFVPIVTARLRRSGDAVAVPAARALVMLIGIQLLLGVGAFVARFTPVYIPGGQLTMLLLPVIHRLVGSLILAAAVVAAVRALHAADGRRAVVAPPVLRLVRG
jgi:hypothetical protein